MQGMVSMVNVQVADELTRRGVAPERRVTIMIKPDEPDGWIAKARRFARPKVVADNCSDIESTS